jgi:hypothetical protein
MTVRRSGVAAGITALVLALCAGGLIAVAPDVAVPTAVLLAPGLAALAFDPTPGRAIARAMLLFEAAACVQPVSAAWYRCDGLQSCMAMLTSGRDVTAVWTMAAAAWLLTQALPIGLKYLSDVRLRGRRGDLEARRQALIDEWGLDGGG